MAEQDMGMDIKINGAETAVNTVEKLADVMGRFGGSLAVASGLVGQLEESLKAFKSIDASTLKNLKEISKLNSVVADAKWTDTHEKYQRAKYDIGGANVDVEYKKWQAAKLKRDEEFANTELGKRRKTARAEAEIKTLEFAVEKERAKIEEMKTKNVARALANQEKEEGIEKRKASRYDSSFGQSILYGLKGYEEKVAAQRNLTGYLGRGLGNLLKDTKVGNIFGGGIAGKGINLGTIIPAAVAPIVSTVVKKAKTFMEDFNVIEPLKTQLGVVYGNRIESDNMFSQISNYATSAPYGVSQATEFAVSLKQSGVYSFELLETLKQIGDVSGGNVEKMKRISSNFAQIQAAGKATTLDLRQFANAGIPIYKELRELLGESQSSLKKMTSEGKITSLVIEKVFDKMTGEGGIFYKATEKTSQTFKAKMLNLQDRRQLMGSEIFEGLYTNQIFDFSALLDTVGKIYEQIADIARKGKNANVSSEVNKERDKVETLRNLRDYAELKYGKDSIVTKYLNTEFSKKDSITSIFDYHKANADNYKNKYGDIEKRKENFAIVQGLANLAIADSGYTDFKTASAINELSRELIKTNVFASMGDYSRWYSELEGVSTATTIRGRLSKDMSRYKNDPLRESYLITEGIGLSENTEIIKARSEKDEKSNEKYFEYVESLYKKTDEYKEKEDEKQLKKLQDIKKRVDDAKKRGIKQDSFGWLSKLTTKEMLEQLPLFYTSERLDFTQELSAEDKTSMQALLTAIKGNLQGSKDDVTRAKGMIEGLVKQLEEGNPEDIAKSLGEYKESLEYIQDEPLKELLSVAFSSLTFNNIDESMINAILADKKKKARKVAEKYMPLWKRLMQSVFGIPVEMVVDYDFDSIVNSAKQEVARKQNQSLLSAMLNDSRFPSKSFETEIYPLIAQQDPEMRKEYGKVNQLSTHENLKAKAFSLSTGVDVSQAYVDTMRETKNSLDSLIAQGFTSKEVYERLQDPKMRKKYGISESDYNVLVAFSNEMGDSVTALSLWRDELQKSIQIGNAGVVTKNLLQAYDDKKTSFNNSFKDFGTNPLKYFSRRDTKEYLGMDDREWKKYVESFKGNSEDATNLRKMMGMNIPTADINNENLIEDELLKKIGDIKLFDKVKGELSGLKESIKDTFSSEVIGQFSNSLELIGSNIAQGKDATDGLAASWKEAGKSILSTIGASMTSAGLNIAAAGATANGGKADWGKVAGGLALAAAGGIMSFTSGLMSEPEEDTSDASSDEEQQKIQNLKDALSDLIDQAKTDAEYYQKHYLHKKALAENYSISVRHVNDAIITPEGQIVSTHPDDYLIATKEPHALLGQRGNTSPTVNFTVINNAGSEVRIEQQQKKNSDGSVDIQAVITKVVNGAIASGKLDGAFAQRDNRLRGRVVTS